MAHDKTAALTGAVLVVDDHAVTRLGLVHLLRDELGARASLQAELFEDALETAKNQAIKLAILDLGLPDLSSPRELARLRRLRPDIRVVVLSASSDRGDILAALEAGVHGYIVKSARTDSLVEKLKYVLSGEISVPPCLAELPTEAVTGRHPGALTERPDRMTADHPLSDRQREVLKGLVLGLSNKQIARELNLAEGTIKMHIGALFRALGANNRAHAAALGKRLID